MKRIRGIEFGLINYSPNSKWVWGISYCYEGCTIVELGPAYFTWLRGECGEYDRDAI